MTDGRNNWYRCAGRMALTVKAPVPNQMGGLCRKGNTGGNTGEGGATTCQMIIGGHAKKMEEAGEARR
jgi:hypothetical protein